MPLHPMSSLTAQSICDALNRVKEPHQLEWVLCIVEHHLRAMNGMGIFELLVEVESELDGYKDHKHLTSVVELIHGHLAMRDMGLIQMT
jgi:hypothetical protein